MKRLLIGLFVCLSLTIESDAQYLPPSLQADIENLLNTFTNNIDGKFLIAHSVTSNKLADTYLTEEADPIWTSASNLYYLQTEADSIFATGTPVYVESDPVWTSEKSNYATGTPIYVESDPIWTSEKSNYATGTPIYVESDPVFSSWISTNSGLSTTITNMGIDTNTYNILTYEGGLLVSVTSTNI